MQNTLMIFENSLVNADRDKISYLIEDLSFSLAYKQLVNSSNKESLLNALLMDFLAILKRLDLLNDENTSRLIKALIKASMQESQNKLYAMINELELLSKQIQNQKNSIKNQTSNYFLEFEKALQDSPYKDEFKSGLNDAILFDLETLGILKETAESAFLTTIEKAEDIEFTSGEIAKYLVYNAVNEAQFEKKRIMQLSEVVLETAFELANTSIIYAKDLSLGAIKGTQEGIELAIDKLKNTLPYANLQINEKELIGIEDEFIALLKLIIQKQKDPCKKIVLTLLENELDSIFAKFKRLANESREQIKLALNELKKSPAIDNFNKLTQRKIDGFKQEISELERLNSEKYKNFNLAQSKQLGLRLWERAKNLLKGNGE
ncbi:MULTISPECIES: hypothetical protein [unclassified Campylobacter]|uniref:hypothetical protein n=1 Tax=unclassified Campylobacter TaxID=2593542 RepID=UPI0012381559|nr:MULTISPECIES: hypothetical protein [unclassified Campylobacter]KAA6227218.1 hypothetical protein FMM57_04580 [Campylobacter sp. LR286c]KAA6227908.1 hypothetical protein FMM54_01895 [Campylobacter sp. LR185c]KAA6228317.1 hypothetical protein FMM55_01705 [Campylobacter sp. LR196d]KAA6229318.1 hypothetical protein FMM58_08140 [Campylobacter sp. LR291e]KAA6231124.1 hypothetical protein FMM56_05405 [Campylobacter sp. LR264d]